MKEFLQKAWERIAFLGGITIAGVTLATIGGKAFDLLSNILGENAGDWIENFRLGGKQRGDAYSVFKNLTQVPDGEGRKYIEGIEDQQILTNEFFVLSSAVIKEMVTRKGNEDASFASLSGAEKLKGKEKKELTRIFTDYLFDTNIREYLLEKSKIFNKMGVSDDLGANEKELCKKRQDAFVKMLENARHDFLNRCFWDLERDHKILISILQEQSVRDKIKASSEIREEIKKSEEAIISTLISVFGRNALDNGGSIRFDELRAMQYSPKFMARRCPECGYCGQRLIYSEKQEMFHCCACGLDYSLIKGIEQDELLMRGLDKLDKSTSLISASINELKASSYKQLADVKDKLAKCCNGIEDAGYTAERIEDSVNILSSDVDQIAERIDSLATEVLKKEYFEKMMKDTSGNMTAVITEIAKGIKETVAGQADATYKSLSKEIEGAQGSVENRISSLERAITKEGERLDNSIDEIKEQLKKLDVINENVLRVLDGVTRAQEQNDALREDMWRCFDGIKGFVREYMSEMERQATRLSEGTPHTLSDGGATALSQADIEKIVAKSIDILTKAQALGAHATNASFDGATASLIYEISQIHTASCGSVNIPDSLKLIEADGDKATCPYCGVEDAHGRVNSDASYYKCKICGNQFLNVKKFRITERECADKELRALALDLRKSIEAWKEAHTVYLVPFNENGKYANNTPNNFLVFGDNIDSEIIVVNLDKRMRRLDGDKMELDDDRICKINEIIDYQHSFARAKRIIFYSREGRDVTISGEFLTGSIGSHVKYKCYTHKGKIN